MLRAGVEECHVVLLMADPTIVSNSDRTSLGFEGRGLTYSSGPSIDQNHDDARLAYAVCGALAEGRIAHFMCVEGCCLYTSAVGTLVFGLWPALTAMERRGVPFYAALLRACVPTLTGVAPMSLRSCAHWRCRRAP